MASKPMPNDREDTMNWTTPPERVWAHPGGTTHGRCRAEYVLADRLALEFAIREGGERHG